MHGKRGEKEAISLQSHYTDVDYPATGALIQHKPNYFGQ